LQRQSSHLLHGARSFSFLSKLGLSAEQSVVHDVSGFSRARLLPLAMLNHLALGSVFAWSIFNKPLTRLHGVVAPSAADWSLTDVSLTFSLVMGGFVWGAVLSNKLDLWGPRASCLAGAGCLGSGFGLVALAAETGSLPLLFAGGAVWGVANGLAYVPPVAMLLKWFPERKGFASGAALVGFGGGALVAAPLFSSLLTKFRQAPEYLVTVFLKIRFVGFFLKLCFLKRALRSQRSCLIATDVCLSVTWRRLQQQPQM
jgi:MFS family permease